MIRSLKHLFVAGAKTGVFLPVVFGVVFAARAATPQLPFCFESGGDTFRAAGPQAQCVIDPAGAALTLRDGSNAPATLRLHFGGAPAALAFHGEAEQPGLINHLIGNEPGQWQLHQTAFGRVRADNVYPGISAVFYGNDRRLEYDLTVAPGARPESIALCFDGTDQLSLDAAGNLVLTLGGRQITQPAPVIYQLVNGTRQAVTGGYRLRDARTAAFHIGAYDHTRPLIIDPILSYSTYFGGNVSQLTQGLAVDGTGNIYLVGSTLSTLFTNNIPKTGFQTNFQGGSLYGDGFIAKFDSTGSNLVYFTYLGGNSEDSVQCVAVDAAGHAWLGGFTRSANFPVTNTFAPLATNVSGTTVNGSYNSDGFLAELKADGTGLIFSGFFGGGESDAITAIALDTNLDIAYVTGYTQSTNFPVSVNALRSHFGATNTLNFNANAFVAALGTNYSAAFATTNKGYSTYLGGTNFDVGTGIAVDGSGYVYVTGYTGSTNFPVTNALASLTFTNFWTVTNIVGSTTNITAYTNAITDNFNVLNGITTNASFAYDAFVTKFQPGCTGLVYSTFLGGTNIDQANGIAVTPGGTVYVTGWTASTNFPDSTRIVGSHVTNNVQGLLVTNAFVVGITNNAAGQPAIAHSLVFGGSQMDIATGLALDTASNIYIIGYTSSTNFPVTGTTNAFGATNASASINYFDAFVTVIKSDWSGLAGSTYLGGWLNDYGTAIAVDASGNAYVAGDTYSTSTSGAGFPVWNARQTQLYGSYDAFLSKISHLAAFAPPPLSISRSTNNVTVSWPQVANFLPGQIIMSTNGNPQSTLQGKTNLLATTWTTLTNVSYGSNGIYQINAPQTNRTGFFRLWYH